MKKELKKELLEKLESLDPNEPVSLEMGKKLKENKFRIPTEYYYFESDDFPYVKRGLKKTKQGEKLLNHNRFGNLMVSAPTVQEVRNWIENN